MTLEIFEQQFGLAGVEYVTSGTPAPAAANIVYGLIVPQGTDPCTIDEITPVSGFTNSDFDGKTITQPLYIPFTTLTLSSGEANVYRLVKNRAGRGGDVQKLQ